MSVLAEVVASADPALLPFAAPDPGTGRFEGREDLSADRAFVLEAVLEGFLTHYREPRAYRDMDRDLRLLAGDSLYALGLSRLAALGDLAAVAELSDLITLCARAEAAGRAELIEPLWAASARALSTAGGPGARASVGGRLSGGPRLR